MINNDAMLTGAVKWISADVLNNDSTGSVIATFNSTNDVKDFVESNISTKGFSENVKLGGKIQINDGTYNKEWIIVGFNTQSSATSQPHISLIPTDSLGNYVMNIDDTNRGGYIGSAAFAICNNIANILARVLGDYLLTRNEFLGNAGYSSYSTTSKSVRVNLLNEIQVFGSRTYSDSRENGYDTTQLPGFKLNKVSKTISSYSIWWLRSAVSGYSNSFCFVDNGSPYYGDARASVAFRPLITIGVKDECD
jgi:hypothetical protein